MEKNQDQEVKYRAITNNSFCKSATNLSVGAIKRAKSGGRINSETREKLDVFVSEIRKKEKGREASQILKYKNITNIKLCHAVTGISTSTIQKAKRGEGITSSIEIKLDDFIAIKFTDKVINQSMIAYHKRQIEFYNNKLKN